MLKEIAEKYRTIYIHLDGEERETEFLKQAESEGFIFGDGTKPTEKTPSDFFAVHSDGTINYINSIGRIAYQAHGVKTLEYSQLKQAHTD